LAQALNRTTIDKTSLPKLLKHIVSACDSEVWKKLMSEQNKKCLRKKTRISDLSLTKVSPWAENVSIKKKLKIKKTHFQDKNQKILLFM
jgi:hypothetical protein